MKKVCGIFALFIALLGTLLCPAAKAQSVSVFSAGLLAPAKIISAPGGTLLVAEGGNGPNTGRISIIDRNGIRRTLVDGLPSAINTVGGEASPSGPSGLALRGNTLYVTIGSGNATLPGTAPGSEIPNPNPASALFSSVLAIRLSSSVESLTGGFSLSAADLASFAVRPEVVLTNASGESLSISLVVNFPNYTVEPRPDALNNVRASNPFGVAVSGKTLYVVDASQNLVYEVDTKTKSYEVQIRFGVKPNPLPFGPPVFEVVPDSVHLMGKQLLVTFLTGFPFPPGQAEVQKINLVNNSPATFIGGLTSAIDVLVAENTDGQRQFFVLEFSANMLASAPGRLRLFASPSAAPVVVADGLITPTGVARNDETGALFVTEIATGRVMRIMPLTAKQSATQRDSTFYIYPIGRKR